MYEAAIVILHRVKRTLHLKDWALAIAERAGPGKARVALARKLSVILHSVRRSGEPSVGSQSHPPLKFQIIRREPDERVALGEVRATARSGPWARDLTSARCGPCSAHAFPIGPDAAAAHADREENHDPEGDEEEVDERGAIRERPFGCKR